MDLRRGVWRSKRRPRQRAGSLLIRQPLDNGRDGLGLLLARTQVEVQKRRRKRTERSEHGVGDDPDCYGTGACAISSGEQQSADRHRSERDPNAQDEPEHMPFVAVGKLPATARRGTHAGLLDGRRLSDHDQTNLEHDAWDQQSEKTEVCSYGCDDRCGSSDR